MKIAWQTKKLGEVCDIYNGFTPRRNNKAFWVNGNIPWFTIDDLREQGRSIKTTAQKITKEALGVNVKRILPVDSILLCCTASVGEYAITKIPLTTNQQFNGLVIRDKKVLDPNYLFYFVSTLKDMLMELSGKTTIDFIPVSRLKNVEISYPDIKEQKRIVKKLDELSGQTQRLEENYKKKLLLLDELKKSVLAKAFA